MDPISKIQVKTTTQLLELANALSVAISMQLMSPGQAHFVWHKHLGESGILPPKEKKPFVKKEIKGGE